MSVDTVQDLNVSPTEKTAILVKAGAFQGLSKEDLERLGQLLKTQECARGEIVIHQGDFGDSIYFISQGEVEVFMQNQEGAESVVAHLKEGNFFGEMALLTGSPRSASVRVQKDAVFLMLMKNDFDEFVKDHPNLAIFFSKLLAERIRTTNTLYVHKVAREEELKRLLSQEEDQHLTRLIGKTKQFQSVEKRVEELAKSDELVIIAGPEGTAGEDVARLIHLRSHRRNRPFIVVDLGGGDEWRAYRSRVESGSSDEEKDDGLFGEFQISTLFGHERGSMSGTEASRLGYLELADRGTVLLKNVDRLHPAAKERLLFYLLEKKSYRLGSSVPMGVDTRVIASVANSTPDEEGKKPLRGKIPEVLLKNRIDLPPLALRRRDIPLIAEAFMEKHAALAGKVIKGISSEAINTLVRYSWPGNDRELESVIERGVLICDGESLSDEHIFLGLKPYSKKGRVNLLRIDPVRRVFANLKLRAYIQGMVVLSMIGAIVLALLGAKDASKNLGMGIVWYYWWPFLLLSFLVLGRFYCSICPINGVTKLSRKLGSLDRPAPRIFTRIEVAVAAVLTLGLFWSEYFFNVKEITIRTPILLGTILSTAIVFNYIFKPEVWCRYICPMGFFSGVSSCLASVEVRANNTVCSSQCKSTNCYKGNDQQEGCPMRLFPVSLTSNQFCKMCGTCIHHCPYKSVHLDLRWPAAEIWENKEPSMVTSLSILALLGILYPLFLREGHLLGMDGQLSFTLLFLGSALGSLAVFTGACLTEGFSGLKERVSAYGFTYLPLTFAGHLAFLLPYLLSGLNWLIAHSLSGEFHRQVSNPWPQRVVIAGGMIWSWWAIRQLSGRKSRIVPLVHGALVLTFGIILFLVVGP